MNFVIRGWHVLAGMLAFFAIIIGVNVAFTVAALRSFPGEDVRRSYTQGLRYNDTLAERRAQDAAGLQVAAGIAPIIGGALLEVELRDAAGAALQGGVVEAGLRWPSDARRDRVLAFREAGGGVYRATVSDLAPGRWRLRGSASASGFTRDFEAELTWPASR